MSGINLVREFRSRNSRKGPQDKRARLKTIALVAGATASALAFGSIIVKAGDDAGIYDMVRSNANSRPFARTTPLPRIFAPSSGQVVRTSLSYAPVFGALMPSGDPSAATKTHRHSSASPRSIKVSPKAKDKDFAEGYLNSRTSYCVRTCDGFFFPLGNPDSGELGAHDAACSRLCPSAETAVYVAPAGSKGVEDAINRKGERYETLRTAFNHRTQFDNACTCSGSGLGLSRNHSVMTDFTLRDGDFIMSGNGMKIFRSQSHFPHRPAEFASADAAKLNAAERKTLLSMEASSMRGITRNTQLSPSLRARIAAQIEGDKATAKAQPRKVNTAFNGQTRKTDAGKDLRYVGPDLDYDRGR